MIEFPVCYILRHRTHGTYIQNNRLSWVNSTHILERYEYDPDWGATFFTTKLDVAKLWPSKKKIKVHLTADSAKYYDIIGSDQTITPAIELFNP